MSMLDDSDVVDDHGHERHATDDDRFAAMAREIDHLRTCLEQLIDVIGNHQDQSEDLVLLAERMAFFERRILRAEDGVADLSWVVTRRVGDR